MCFSPPPRRSRSRPERPSTLFSSTARAAVRAAIRLAGGREVCFVCTVGEDGEVVTARVVARGDATSVLALPGFAQRGELLLHNHPSGNLDPSDADLHIAAKMHDCGVGFAITDNFARELYVVLEVPREAKRVPIAPEDVEAALRVAGPVGRALGQYEDRPSQRAYARTVAKLYNSGGVGLLEAGTGVGKSLGYLVPALRWAAANGQRTVVSTNTINLQEQLVGKDLPFLATALDDQPVRFALLKGWRNYLCLYRLEQARVAGPTLFDDDVRAELEDLVDWSEQTADGTVSDLPVQPRAEIWDEVAAESDLCLRLKCPMYDRCFLFGARRQAAQADVIVVNHHLLLADLAVRRSSQNWDDAAVLPPYSRLILDEGHHVEDAAASHLGATITRNAMVRLFSRLERHGRGLLPTLVGRLGSRHDLLSTASLDLVHSRLFPAATAARRQADIVFDLLEGVMVGQGALTMRLTAEFAAHPVWSSGLDASLDDLLGELSLLGDNLRLIRDRLENDENVLEAHAHLMGEIRGVTRRLDMASDALRAALRPPNDGMPTVRWLELRGKERNVATVAVPLDLAPILREDLFRRLDTAIVTSATLTTDGKFGFLARRLGLDDSDLEPEAAVFPSPFNYGEQALLGVPVDTPPPNTDGSGHFAAVVDALDHLAGCAGGGVFALFTSHRDVRQAAAALRSRGASSRWPLLVHGEETRDVLLRRFRAGGNSVLLGTASFWEGVDVPGDALRALLLAKIPFKVPTEPLTAAHCEAINHRGGDSFQEYMVPHAALRLKQGFGRLIRRSDDRGVVLLMDPRVATMRYGEGLLDGLPPARRVVGTTSEVRRAVEKFFR
ncbi:MAG: helicase C-terminal domain-containing protein [Gemmatimonadota bacterium]